MHEHIGCSFNQLWVVLLLQVVCKSGFKDLFPNTVQQSGANIPGQRVLLELPWQSGVGEGLGAVAAASTLWRLPSAGAAGFISLLLRCHLWELPHKIVSLATK